LKPLPGDSSLSPRSLAWTGHIRVAPYHKVLKDNEVIVFQEHAPLNSRHRSPQDTARWMRDRARLGPARAALGAPCRQGAAARSEALHGPAHRDPRYQPERARPEAPPPGGA